MQASLSSCKQRLRQDDGGKDRKPVYKHNQQLEELRNLQDRLTHEKEAWNREKENEEKDIEERRVELLRLQEQIRTEQADIIQQREQLYRRMEMLTSQGILISPNMPVVTAGPGQDEFQQDQTVTRTLTTPSPPAENRRKLENKWKPLSSGGTTPTTNPPGTNAGKVPLPINLISATNQQKAVAQSVQVKQQLPLKLAKLASGSGTVTGPSREGVTQMLPLKLSQMESLANKRAGAGGDKANLQVGSYQRLSSNSFSPNSIARDESSGSSGAGMPTHVRTGSSPAMMQPNTSPAQQQQTTDRTRSPPEAKEEELMHSYILSTIWAVHLQMISEEKDGDHHHHHHHGYHENLSDDVPATMHLEFLDESKYNYTVKVTKKLKEKEIKRQEHIYEFILTEKHHCLTLRVMQKVFVDGFQKYFQMGHNLDRMFPRLADLTDIHLGFLHKLREKQKTSSPTIDSIADILLEQFSGLEAEKLKSAYGEFCSRHRDAVDLYKDYLQQDHRFGEFVRHCQTNPLLKKKGIPECVLFVTQRLTKYPLLIEPLIKSAKENKKEQEKLSKALALVKEILVAVDAQVAEKEKEDRKLEIYNRIDAKSFTTHRNKKFKKSDILSNNRRLRFEGLATLMQGRSKMQLVLAGVVSLQKLLVREKAGQESRGIYLISSNPSDPEMFELKVHKPKDKLSWINAVRQAVERCPEEEEEAQALSMEEKQRLLEAKRTQIQQIVGVLRKKDMEQAQILEDKMALQLQLLAAAGLTNLPEPPSYTHLVAEDADSCSMWKEVLSAFH
ncbi:hypothetical protein B566_EDAN005253, partial [Ephemera danica]